VITTRYTLLVAVLTAACSGGAVVDQARSPQNLIEAPVPAPDQPSPPMRNRGTAPDWIGICVTRAMSESGVARNEVRLTETDAREDGSKVAVGMAGGTRFRCEAGPDDRVRSFRVLEQ
jgi:hypothetical protein